jgi:hypothetical protein
MRKIRPSLERVTYPHGAFSYRSSRSSISD